MRAMSNEADLKTPVLLLAMPQVYDPFFNRSVVLLVHHDEEGSFGLIVNRATDILIRDILLGMEIEWQGDPDAVAHFGGPVRPQLGTILFTQMPDDAPLSDAVAEVAPGLAITQHVHDLTQLAAEPPGAFRLFLGYAGWGASQLMDEILRNDWLIAPVTHELLFDIDRGLIWEEALRSVGIDPSTLPAWTTPAGEGSAN